jgi:phosphoenolpyruvate-protein kinase (PTS system EI component)
MIETPASALSLPEISKHVDFMSFGTSDLTQYTFATDWENASVESYFDNTHDSILGCSKLSTRMILLYQ